MNNQLFIRLGGLCLGLCLYLQIGFTQFQSIEIRENQTSHLIFPADILYTDIGDNDNFIVAYTNNILRVKGMKNQQPTNLTVITKDNYYYSFYVRYSNSPQLNYFIKTEHSIKQLAKKEDTPAIKTPKPVPATQELVPRKAQVKYTTQKTQPSKKNNPPKHVINQDKLLLQAKKIRTQSNRFDYISARHGDILLKITGIYHSLEHCFISYQVRNKGAIPYDISYIEFGMKEKRRAKKSAINEAIFTPVLLLDKQQLRVPPKRTNTYVAVFNKIAVPQGKIFYIELVEAGRNILLHIPYNKLPIEQL